jgi:phytoene dehydrogenase-like protein
MTPQVVIVGGGHNGLVAAGLLAKRGVRTLVLERREVLGGATVTEEFHPGFKVSSLAHTAGPLRPSVVAALGLDRLGLELMEADPRVVAPLPDGRAIAFYSDAARTAKGLEAVSEADARAYPRFHEAMTRVAKAAAGLLDMTPPDIGKPGLRDLAALGRVGLKVRGLGRNDFQNLLRWGPMAVADFAQEWFESDAVRAVVCARGIRGTFAGPWSAGTTANLLLRATAAGGGAESAVVARGGLGALAQALAKAAQAHGAEIRTGAPVARITSSEGAVTGVVLASGEEVKASVVVSSADPHTTFLRLLDPGALDPEDLQRMRNYRIAGMASKVHLALSGAPKFRGVEDAKLLAGRIHIGPGVDYLERAYDDSKYGRMSEHPYLDVTIPTLLDPSLAPEGRHVLSAYVQYTPVKLRGSDWAKERDALGDRVLRTLEEYAPGISGLVLARQVLTPRDLEETYGLSGGHPDHGEHALDQLFTMRPLIGWGRYRGPLRGLFHCGAGSHPGGGVTGAPGQNAAREILRAL